MRVVAAVSPAQVPVAGVGGIRGRDRVVVATTALVGVAGGVGVNGLAGEPGGLRLRLTGDLVELVQRSRGLERTVLQSGGHVVQALLTGADPVPLLLGALGDRTVLGGVGAVDLVAQSPQRLQVLQDRPLLVVPDAVPARRQAQEGGGVGDDVVERVQELGTLLQLGGPSQHRHAEPLGAVGVAEVLPGAGDLLILLTEPPVAGHDLGTVRLILGDRAGQELGGLVVVGDLRVVAQRLARPASRRETAPQVPAEQDEAHKCRDSGQDVGRAHITASGPTDDVGGLGRHGESAPVPVGPAVLFLGGVLDGGLLLQGDRDVLTEVAADLARLRGDRQDHQAVAPVVGVRRRDPRDVGVALVRAGVLQHRVVKVVDVPARDCEHGDVDVLTEAHRPDLLGQWLALEHPGLVVDLHAGVMALPEGPDDHDRQHGDEGQAHHHIGDEGRHRPDSA